MGQAVLPEPLVLLVQHLLLADCSVKAVVVEVVALLARVVLAVLEVQALVAVVARVVAAHTQQVLVALAVMVML